MMNSAIVNRSDSSDTRAARVLETRNRAFRVLYDTVMEVEGTSEEDVYAVLCRNLRRICDARYAVLSEYDPTTSTLIFKAASCEDSGEVISDDGARCPSTCVTPVMLKRYTEQQVRTCFGHEGGCTIDTLAEAFLQNKASAEDVVPYCLSSVREGTLIAVAKVYLPADERLRLKDIVDTFMNLAGMILQRVQTTRALKKTLDELARHNRTMTGREEKIVELKVQVNALLEELGRERIYGKADEVIKQFNNFWSLKLREQAEVGESRDQGIREPGDQELAVNAPDVAETLGADEALDIAATLGGIKQLQGLLESYCELIGVASAIIDLKGEVLVGAKWKRICTDFHRKNPNTCRKCIESDTVIANGLREGERVSVYICKNGLADAAAPIVVHGKHVANLFVGQFLLDQPDMDFFRKQAAENGFPEDEYLSALDDVPVIDRHKLDVILEFLSEFASLVSSMGVGQSSLSRANIDLRNNREVLLSLMEDLIAAREKAEEYASQAEAATRSKSAFLANMSHEIRTPMTAILGFAENLLEPDLSESDRLNAIQTIRRNGKYLLGIINDILDLSKVEAGKMTVEYITCEPCRLIADVASLVNVKADARGLAFSVEYNSPIPDTILTDPTRLRQILINLLSNAIKFTDNGRVRLITRFVNDVDQPYMQFDVVDTGLGMTQEQVNALFQPFTQADSSTTRRFGGTGLGLVISKRFAEMLGGDISVVETVEGIGTRFRVTVAIGVGSEVKMIDDPMSATVVAASEAATVVMSTGQAALQDYRILLAEDGPDNQRLITHVLKKDGAEVVVKENGKQAVEVALSARDEGNPFDVILMDMQMPIMDGYEATSYLRKKGYKGPIIALTAHAMEGDQQKCLDAGCDGYGTKPIDRKKLVETIRNHNQNKCGSSGNMHL